jgi:hypothetical protein
MTIINTTTVFRRHADLDDDRLTQLIGYCDSDDDGFANNCIWKSELFAALLELKRFREKPLHCPSCDGDHL